MKNYLYVPMMVLLFSTFTHTALQAATSYEMQRYCKDEAVRTYRLKREKIYTAVPRFLNGKYSVYSQSPKNTKRALFFSCHFNRHGRFINIQTEKDMRKNNQHPVKVPRAAKRSCKDEASSVWRVSQRDVRLSNIRRVNSGRYKMTVQARNRTAVCDVNAQGNIYRFHVQGKQQSGKKPAKQACKRLAARLWKVPSSRISIQGVRNTSRERYDMEVRYRHTRGSCDVSRNGYVHHFRTIR